MAGPAALLLLGQSPFDPASGAARSMQTLARWLARGGWRVVSVSTNAAESPRQASGLSAEFIAHTVGGAQIRRDGAVSRMDFDGVEWRWVETSRQHHWREDAGAVFHSLLTDTLAELRPALVLTFGDDPGDRMERRLCRSAGARLVFALHNLAYLDRRIDNVDAFLCPSEFLARAYQRAGFRPIHHLPLPVEPVTMAGPPWEPLCAVFVNPEPAKGLSLVAALAARLARDRPDIPLLVVSGRASVGHFCIALREHGVDPALMNNLMLAPDGLQTHEFLRLARVVLMPSLVPEAGGRVAVEAQSVGAVPLVSDRGALPEVVGEGGVVLGLPSSLNDRPGLCLPIASTEAWWSALTRLFDDETHWSALSVRARLNAARHDAVSGVPALTHWAGQIVQAS